MQITEQGLLEAIAQYQQQEARARAAAERAHGAAVACEYLLGVLRSKQESPGAPAPTEPPPQPEPSCPQ